MNNFTEKFLESRYKRYLQILLFLYSENRYFSIDELAELLDCNKKTIRRAMIDLSYELNKWEKSVSLVFETRKGYRLKLAPSFSIREIELNFLKESTLFIICEDILLGKALDIGSFAAKHYMSYTAIYNRINDLKLLFNEFDLDLNVKQLDTVIGAEKQIRYFSLLFFWCSFGGEKWAFQQVDKASLTPILRIVAEFRQGKATISQKESLYILQGIIFARLSQGNSVTMEEFKDDFFEQDACYLAFKGDYIHFLKQHFPLAEEILEQEARFLYALVMSQTSYESDFVAANKMVANSQLVASTASEATKLWLKTFLRFFDIPDFSDAYELLYANVYHLHLRIYFFKGYNHLFMNEQYIVDKGLFGQELEKICEKFYAALLLEESAVTFFNNRRELFPNYFSIIYQFIHLLHQRNPLNICLLSSQGEIAARSLMQIIRRSYFETCHIVLDVEETTDLIISDQPLSLLKDCDKQVLCWNTLPTAFDLERLTTMIDQIACEKFLLERGTSK